MRVLITGANGQLGRELVDVFGKPGHHELAACSRGQLDLGDRDSVLGVITSSKPDVIIHSGAYTAVDLCESNVDEALRINALGTRHVVDAAERIGARVLYVSTDYVFDGTQDRPYDEWDQPNPQSVYGRSKLAGEHELRPADTIVRTSWVFGRHGANMVKTVLRLADSHPTLSFVNDQHGNPTAADDLARAIYDLAVGEVPGRFHVTNSGATTWFDFVRTVMKAAGQDPERVLPVSTAELSPPRPAPRPANSVLDNAAWRLSGRTELPHHEEAVSRIVRTLLGE